ncbi:MAG: transcriptional regulator [Pseudonocardiaceae bacterium]
MNLGDLGGLFALLFVAHQVGDYWVQTHHQANHKHLCDRRGRLACAGHVVTYTTGTAVAVLVAILAFGAPISITGFLAGQAISAATHYWADRRFTLERLAGLLGKSRFYRLGQPREIAAYTEVVTIDGEDYELHVYPHTVGDGRQEWDNPSLGTGAHALDQAWHYTWLLVAAVVTLGIG